MEYIFLDTKLDLKAFVYLLYTAVDLKHIFDREKQFETTEERSVFYIS